MKKLLLAVIVVVFSGVVFSTWNVSEVVAKEWTTHSANRVSVHDPSITSIVKDGKETFYIFGSHLAQAKTTNFQTWDIPFTTEYENPSNNLMLGNLKENLKESFKWAGYDDANSKGGYAIWAPDVIWNEKYEWPNGEKGAYMYYYSTSSTWRRSCIGYAVSKSIEGPFTYGNTIIYSGFTEKDATDGSTRNTNYQNTNVSQLIKNGKLSGFSQNWSKDNGVTYNTDYAPNAIDPALFHDQEGKLWMTYGSWSGGIFLLEIDQTTGNPIYPGKDSVKPSGQPIDRYFGVKLAGGYHQSGEGPFIVYDRSVGYYYLFETYGGLFADGGYNMRLFRSKSPDGPYVDAKGNTPLFTKDSVNSDYGVKVMGNYQFEQMTVAYKAQGHNSAIISQNGQWYLAYHTRFNTGAENHEVRIHTMYMNEAGWPVTTPYEYRKGESRTVASSEIAGSYQFIQHGTDNGTTVLPTETIQLTSDGKITGAVTGTWKQTSARSGIQLVMNGVTYTGVLTKQNDESTNAKIVVTFSAIGNNNETIWGSKK